MPLPTAPAERQKLRLPFTRAITARAALPVAVVLALCPQLAACEQKPPDIPRPTEPRRHRSIHLSSLPSASLTASTSAPQRLRQPTSRRAVLDLVEAFFSELRSTSPKLGHLLTPQTRFVVGDDIKRGSAIASLVHGLGHESPLSPIDYDPDTLHISHTAQGQDLVSLQITTKDQRYGFASLLIETPSVTRRRAAVEGAASDERHGSSAHGRGGSGLQASKSTGLRIVSVRLATEPID